MDCWCISSNAHKISRARILSHLQTMSFSDLIAHANDTDETEFTEWCRVRGATRDLRVANKKYWRPINNEKMFNAALHALHGSNPLMCPAVILPRTITADNVRTATTALTKMRVSCEWARVAVHDWNAMYDMKPAYPKDLLCLIGQFVGTFATASFTDWTRVNGKRAFATDLKGYLAYLRANKPENNS